MNLFRVNKKRFFAKTMELFSLCLLSGWHSAVLFVPFTHRPHLKQDYESFAEQWPRVVIGRWQIRLWEKESTSSFNFVALHIRT